MPSQPDDRARHLGRIRQARDWPMASAVAVALAGADGGADDALQPLRGPGGGRRMNRRPTFLITVLCFGFAFFYMPILSMIVFSFNASRLATVWGGFSTKWYVSLFSNDRSSTRWCCR
jgi:ABC-type spermidine/putrescine transport system permease subunit I